MTNLGSPRSTKEPARISGNVVIAKVSGEVISVSGIVIIVSSVVIHTEVSGSWVSVSGSTVVTIPEYNTVEAAAAGSGALNLTLSVADTCVVDYATYHGDVAVVTSSELYLQLQHGTSTGFYTKIVSVDMARHQVSNVYWTPDAELWLTSGDSINMAFSNPDTCNYGAAIRVRRL